MHQVAHPGYVRHRVQGPHLVEVDLAHLHPVGSGLGLGNAPVGLLGVLPHGLRQGEAVDEGGDVPQGAVLVMMVMLMLMLMPVSVVVVVMGAVPLLPAVDRDAHVGSGNALAGDAPGLHAHAGDEGVHIPQKFLLLRAQLVEGRHEHVPRGAHGALKIQRLHVSSIPFIWLIRWARKPPPKPLSIFTTFTPLAQELSMASSAARPPRLAP